MLKDKRDLLIGELEAWATAVECTQPVAARNAYEAPARLYVAEEKAGVAGAMLSRHRLIQVEIEIPNAD